MSTTKTSRSNENKAPPASKKPKKQSPNNNCQEEEEAFLKTISTDPDRAFEALREFHNRLKHTAPEEAKEVMAHAKEGKGTLLNYNNLLDGNWNLLADDKSGQVVGGVSFSAHGDGTISLDDFWLGECRLKVFAAESTTSAYGKSLEFNVPFKICGDDQCGSLYIVAAEEAKGADGLYAVPLKHPRAEFNSPVEPEDLDLPSCYDALILVRAEENY